ncbi:MAG: NnrS family protein [Gammaproteobacteria bacterium]
MNTVLSSAQQIRVPPLLQQPFRLLFLCASLCASLEILVWALFLHLGLIPATALPPLLWHGHEMLYGFAAALMAGFMLTAVAEWTRLPTVTPVSLLILVMVWLAARIAFLLPAVIPYPVTAVVDCAFFPLLAVLIARPILRSRNRRNVFLIPLLLAFVLADILFHLAVTGVIRLTAYNTLVWVIDLLTVLMLVIGGRVIPFFTQRRLSGIEVRSYRWVNWSVNGGAALLVLLDIILPGSMVLAIVSLLVALLVLVRLSGWRSLKTWREPMLWVLHLGYLWLAIGLILRGVSLLTHDFPEITALHAITVGALGSLSIGMMTRVPLGHTGRLLTAGVPMTVAFGLVTLAAILRVSGVSSLWSIAGIVWTLAFAIYFIRFIPVHFGPRRT